jgi:hypothetical protein
MSNLYGIESEADCRQKMDELLEMCLHARQAMNREAMGVLKDRLKKYYKTGDGNRRNNRMSNIERTFFWPAIQGAYLNAPSLIAHRTWQAGLAKIESELLYWKQMLPH